MSRRLISSSADVVSDGIPTDNSDPQLCRTGKSSQSVTTGSSLLDSETKDWMAFSAAVATDQLTRDNMITKVYAYATSAMNGTPLAVEYNPSSAFEVGGIARWAFSLAFRCIDQQIRILQSCTGCIVFYAYLGVRLAD